MKKNPKRYVDQFLNYKAAGDIIGILSPIQRISKEISEAMAVIKHTKAIMLKEPMKWTLIDLCSGNALVPAISAFTLPSAHNYAVDIRPRTRAWSDIRRFDYLTMNIHDKGTRDMITAAGSKVILTAVHACGNLARHIIQLYNQTPAQHLILVPCCGKNNHKLVVSDNLRKRIGKDTLWAMDLASRIGGYNDVKLSLDTGIISPRNLVIMANKHMKGEK